VLDLGVAWIWDGRRIAVATVVNTWGSAPVPVGSQLIVDERGDFAGSVSGGCIEGAVIEAATGVIADGAPRLLKFGVTNERAWEVGLSCGGEIEIFVERWLQSGLQSKLHSCREQGRPAALVTRLADGAQALVCDAMAEGSLQLDGDTLKEIGSRIRSDTSGRMDDGLFVRVYGPLPRMLLVGAVHISQELVKLAPAAGFHVTIIDPRTAFATPDRFPSLNLVTEWPDQAMARLKPDRGTAVITLTHDPKLDDPALLKALASDAFFIGALGSRKTHASRLKRLREQGVPEQQLERIHAPVGLPLGGRRPGEIAVAILAQVIQARYAGAGP
jgi:xanthine dehydrogenase accessory factor